MKKKPSQQGPPGRKTRQGGVEHLCGDERRNVIAQSFLFLPEAPQKPTGASGLGRRQTEGCQWRRRRRQKTHTDACKKHTQACGRTCVKRAHGQPLFGAKTAPVRTQTEVWTSLLFPPGPRGAAMMEMESAADRL